MASSTPLALMVLLLATGSLIVVLIVIISIMVALLMALIVASILLVGIIYIGVVVTSKEKNEWNKPDRSQSGWGRGADLRFIVIAISSLWLLAVIVGVVIALSLIVLVMAIGWILLMAVAVIVLSMRMSRHPRERILFLVGLELEKVSRM